MAQLLLLLVVALTVGAVVFGVMVLVSGSDPGLRGVEPDGRAIPLPGSRPLVESDVVQTTFDTASGFFVARGYRTAQVDQALRRVAYDIGYKDELIGVLSAEVEALREGRIEDADALRAARLAALGEATPAEIGVSMAGRGEGSPAGSESGVIELGEIAPATQAAAASAKPETEAPEGPFAPWPADGHAADEAANETDHATDSGGGSPEPAVSGVDNSPPGQSPAQKVATRG